MSKFDRQPDQVLYEKPRPPAGLSPEAKAAIEHAATMKARAWLLSQGVRLTREDMAAEKLLRGPKPDPRDWARKVMTRHIAGEWLPSLCISNAKAALR